MRTLEANHTLGQQQAARTPYFKLLFKDKTEATTVDLSSDSSTYGDRILLIDHTEEPYNDYAYIMLRDNERDIPDLLGYHTNIQYGDYYSGTAYYSGGKTAKLWVKEQRIISAGGKLYTLLVLEGIWSFFREQQLIGNLTDGIWLKRYYNPEDEDNTTMISGSMNIFDCIYTLEQLVDDACGTDIVLYMDNSQDDGIILDYVPGRELNAVPYENCSDFLQQLLGFTKCFIRMKNNDSMEIRHPQDSDATDVTYYNDQAPYFYEFVSDSPLLIPNRVIVFHGQDSDPNSPTFGDWPDEATVIAEMGDYKDDAEIAKYMEVAKVYVSGFIVSHDDADKRAEAILYKVEYQQVHGQLVIPHDASVELYDKVEIRDTRGT